MTFWIMATGVRPCQGWNHAYCKQEKMRDLEPSAAEISLGRVWIICHLAHRASIMKLFGCIVWSECQMSWFTFDFLWWYKQGGKRQMKIIARRDWPWGRRLRLPDSIEIAAASIKVTPCVHHTNEKTNTKRPRKWKWPCQSCIDCRNSRRGENGHFANISPSACRKQQSADCVDEIEQPAVDRIGPVSILQNAHDVQSPTGKDALIDWVSPYFRWNLQSNRSMDQKILT